MTQRRLTTAEWETLKHWACRGPWGHVACLPDDFNDDRWAVSEEEIGYTVREFAHPALGTVAVATPPPSWT